MANWESIFNMVVPAVTTLVKIAEGWFNTPKSGAKKKEFVHKSAMQIFKSAEGLTTGGAHHTVEVLEKHLPDLIDATAGVVVAAEKKENEGKEGEPNERRY